MYQTKVMTQQSARSRALLKGGVKANARPVVRVARAPSKVVQIPRHISAKIEYGRLAKDLHYVNEAERYGSEADNEVWKVVTKARMRFLLQTYGHMW